MSIYDRCGFNSIGHSKNLKCRALGDDEVDFVKLFFSQTRNGKLLASSWCPLDCCYSERVARVDTGSNWMTNVGKYRQVL